jgi:predicted phage terminase large subunit-like protein
MSDVRKALQAALRKHFPMFVCRCFLHLNPGAEFVKNWHIEAIAHQLDRVLSGQSTRLVINLPPRYLKSTIVTVAWIAFILGNDPRRRILCVSYSDELSRKFTSDFRAIVESQWYRKLFPRMRIKRATDTDVETTMRGYRKATSVYASLTGFGGDLIILDDPQKPVDAQSKVQRDKLNAWVSNTLLPRLDNKETGAVVLVMQRLHFDDLTGHLLSAQTPWTLLKLPAIALKRERISLGDGGFYVRKKGEVLSKHQDSLKTMLRVREEMGARTFDTQFQQCPMPLNGKIINRDWFCYYDEEPERSSDDKVVQSWDTSAKLGAQNAWSVCMTFLVSKDRYYLIDRWRGRLEYRDLRDKAIALARQFRPSIILIEEASTGIPLAQELRRDGNLPVHAVPVARDKEARLYAVLSSFERGKVLFKRNAPYLRELEEELLSFPESKTDDQVDSITQALAYKLSSYDSTMEWVGNGRDGRYTFGDYLVAMRSRGLI